MLKNNQKNFKLIERHFDYDLSEEEANQFYEKLDTDPKFKKQVQLFEIAHRQALEFAIPEFEAKKAQMIRDVAKKPSLKLAYKQVLALAAALLLLFVGSFTIFSQSATNVPRAKEMAAYQLHQINLDGFANMTRGTTTTSSSLKAAFDKKEYQKVIRLSDTLEKTADMHLLRGIAFYDLNKLEQAKTTLLEVDRIQQGQLDIAWWALASIYLKQEDYATARTYLQKIASKNTTSQTYKSPTKNKAEHVLKLLP